MKRTLRIALLFSVLFIISDEAWSRLVTLLHKTYTASLTDNAWQFSSFELAYLLVTGIVFLVSGAIVTCFISQRLSALLLSCGLGVAVPASRLFFEQPRPWFYQDHGVTWLLLTVSWANWWLPPLAACIGAIATYKLWTKCPKS
ncbi:MAG TPA: hypothetical protein VIU93_12650 [Gallionellaceae bacterium]